MQRSSRSLCRALVLAALLAPWLAAAPARGEPAIELDGSWYVLIHYTDDTTHDAKQQRWDDRLWVFERKGKELEWKEYPLVIFQSDSGRFEASSGHQARVLAAWEPDPGQRAEIAAGLQFNTRGSKQKLLKAADGGGWRSGGGARSQAANVISYVETWSIEGDPAKPTFVRLDSMGSSEDDVAEGRTEYRTETVEQGGALLRGKFERDGTRHGTFQLIRSGAARALDASGKTPNEKARDRVLERIREEQGKAAEDLSPEEIDRLLRERGVE